MGGSGSGRKFRALSGFRFAPQVPTKYIKMLIPVWLAGQNHCSNAGQTQCGNDILDVVAGAVAGGHSTATSTATVVPAQNKDVPFFADAWKRNRSLATCMPRFAQKIRFVSLILFYSLPASVF